MTPLLADRVNEPERLDDVVHDPGALRTNLRHLAGVSRWLGGERSVVRHLERHVTDTTGITLLDVGTGGADLPLRLLQRYADESGIDCTIFAVDRQLSVARLAVETCRTLPRVHILVGDGLQLPLPDNCVDVAYSATTLHHVKTPDAVVFVKELARVARRAVIVSDLERNIVALAGAHLLARTWWRRSPYRFDGPLSVRRAFTCPELLEVGVAAGLGAPRVHRHFPFRLTLVGESV